MLKSAGNLWTYPAEYRLITTNGVVKSNGELVMGAGVAKQAKEKYPNLPKVLGQYVSLYGNRPFILTNEKLITFPTKEHFKEDSDLILIEKSAKFIVDIVNK